MLLATTDTLPRSYEALSLVSTTANSGAIISAAPSHIAKSLAKAREALLKQAKKPGRQ